MASYRVIGLQAVVIDKVAHAPGEVFDADLTEQKEAFLVGIEAIERVESASTPAVVDPEAAQFGESPSEGKGRE
jgi:hypothetical protein